MKFEALFTNLTWTKISSLKKILKNSAFSSFEYRSFQSKNDKYNFFFWLDSKNLHSFNIFSAWCIGLLFEFSE